MQPESRKNENGPTVEGTTGSKWKSAWNEVTHFAGGLVHHPVESTRHFSILRHSHGLVYYKGPATWIAISTFSDKPLPAERSYWLQSRGWSGNTGTRIAASFMGFGRNWIEVTPSSRIDESQLDASDARAWTRDIKKFAKKDENGKKHVVRETAILRIPCSALDGYFRVLLVDGASGHRKVLCPSPAFRIASTSASPSSVRGATLSTLPLELGIKTLSLVTTETATTLVEPAISPVSQYMSTSAVGQAASTAQTIGQPLYDASGAAEKVDALNEAYEEARERSLQMATGAMNPDSLIIGDDSGPQPPYPIRFSGKVERGSGESAKRYGIPTANLANVHESHLHRLAGVYVAWSCVKLAKLPDMKRSDVPEGCLDWSPAVVTVRNSSTPKPTVLPKKQVYVHIIDRSGIQDLTGHDVSVTLMGYLHPFHPERSPTGNALADQREASRYTAAMMLDISVSRLSLARSSWGMEVILSRHSSRTLSEKYVDGRQAAARQLERVPTHRAGVRTEVLQRRDTNGERGGMFILR